MKENICKFIPESAVRSLCAERFIYETDPERLTDSALPPHERVLLVCAGCATYVSSTLTASVSTGMLIFARNEYHFEDIDGFACIYIDFYGDRAQELCDRFGITQSNCIFNGFEDIIPIWKDSLIKANSKNTDLLSESMLLYAFSKLSASSKSSSALSDVMRYIDDNFTDTDLSLSLVAQKFGYNPKYLSTLFKQKNKLGFSEYIKNLRIKRSLFLIEQGITTVKNVAFLSGFSDPFYFSDVFTEALGIRPTEYMKSFESTHNAL